MKHLLIVIVMILVWVIGFIWFGHQIDPSTKYLTDVEYRFAKYCAGCHGNSGVGNGRIGRFKKLDPADLTDENLWSAHNDVQLLKSIASGKNDMPAFHYYLNDEQQQEILDFIKATFRP